MTNQEREAWAHLWNLPQAVAWEQLAMDRLVARYVRILVVSEGSKSTAALLSEVRQLEDRLGLTPMSLKRLQWDIDGRTDDERNRAGVTSLDAYRDL